MCTVCAKHFANVSRIDPQKSLSKRVFLLGKMGLGHFKTSMGELLVGFPRQTSKNWVLAGDSHSIVPFSCSIRIKTGNVTFGLRGPTVDSDYQDQPNQLDPLTMCDWFKVFKPSCTERASGREWAREPAGCASYLRMNTSS